MGRRKRRYTKRAAKWNPLPEPLSAGEAVEAIDRGEVTPPRRVAPIDPHGAVHDAAQLEAAQIDEEGEDAERAEASPEPPHTPYTLSEAERDLRDAAKALLRVPALLLRARRGRRPDLARVDSTADRLARAAGPRALGQGDWLFWAGIAGALISDVLDDLIDEACERTADPSSVSRQTVTQDGQLVHLGGSR